MKTKKKLVFGALVAGCFILSSCSLLPVSENANTVKTTITEHISSDGSYSVPQPDSKGSYSVTFVLNNGYTYTSTTNKNEYVLKPDDPEKVDSTFKGWYSDEDLTSLFNFNREVSEDTILYAGWDTDYFSLFNTVSTEYILANVRLEITNYDLTSFGRQQTNVSSTLGSGVIFTSDSSYYYALTNNHVVYTTKSRQQLMLEDAYESEYSFEILGSSSTYDLALIRFKKGSNSLKSVELADYMLDEGEHVFTMGEPEGLSNTVSVGEILGIRAFEPNEDDIAMSNVTFNVYRTSAPIQSGSSGGALIDSNLKLLGINFASAVDSNTDEFKYSYAIPAPKVREFVSTYISL